MVGELIAGRYELEELVGSGGMSSVYRAHDRLLERAVALKILHEQFTRDDDYVERFRREARAVAQLAHPNIVTVIDRGEQDGRQFIVFEYIDGMNLKELMAEEGPLSPREAIELALQVARGLSFAHDQGLVHRDVKPQNVLLDADGRAKVTDFGIAHAVDVDGMTITGTIMGTSNYIAPEQARGQPVDEQTDVYSLGCVLYELLTGEVPFAGDNFVAVAMRHVNDPVPSVRDARPDVPPRLDRAIQQAMAKDHGERFESMADFAAELEACHAELDGNEGATMVVPARSRTRLKSRRPARARRHWSVWPFVLLGVGLAALVGGLAGAILLQDNGGGSSSNPPPPPTGSVQLRGVTAFDPEGSPPGEEHNDTAKYATDNDPKTYWRTEHYNGAQLAKSGVGVVLDAGRPVALRSLTVTSETPEFTAVIKAGSSEGGPFSVDSAPSTVGSSTTFRLNGKNARYYLVWITDLGGNDQVQIQEVKTR
ncbi:MAG: serine/threonine protein kinase [Actinobacteria bacterium]|nr:MAG: serine/threonine protein kinase [Actinomycetota bacterium]